MGKPGRIICQPGTSHQRERASRKREAHERLTEDHIAHLSMRQVRCHAER